MLKSIFNITKFEIQSSLYVSNFNPKRKPRLTYFWIHDSVMKLKKKNVRRTTTYNLKSSLPCFTIFRRKLLNIHKIISWDSR